MKHLKTALPLLAILSTTCESDSNALEAPKYDTAMEQEVNPLLKTYAEGLHDAWYQGYEFGSDSQRETCNRDIAKLLDREELLPSTGTSLEDEAMAQDYESEAIKLYVEALRKDLNADYINSFK